MTFASDPVSTAAEDGQAAYHHQTENISRQQLAADPEHANAHFSLGMLALQRGEHVHAAECFRRALALVPGNVDYHNALGVAYKSIGKLDLAVACYQQSLRRRPEQPEVYCNLGHALLLQNNKDAAVRCYQETVRRKPNHAPAHYNLGYLLRERGQVEEALHHYQQAAQANPQSAEIHNNLGGVLIELRRHEEGVAHCRFALHLKPDYASAHTNLGGALAKLDKLEEGIAHCRYAVRLAPHDAAVLNNLGLVLAAAGHYSEAVTYYERALALDPSQANTHWNIGLVRLLLGDFEQGWRGYEWRRTQPHIAPRHFPQVEWDGSVQPGATILLHAEQGLGDTFQFVRYALLVKQRVGKVVVECQPALLSILAGAPGIDQLVPRGSPLPPFDVQAPLLSLPGIFHTSMDTIPAPIPYLRANPELVNHWRRELEPFGQIKIGICWQGSHDGDPRRSIPLAQFEPLTRVKGVHLISLQKGLGSEQLSALAGRFPVVDLGRRLDEGSKPFMDTAAIMMNLDLVISSDNGVIHLAGALGVPVWVGLPLVPEWRWQLEREDSPWYPRMRLFRQTRPGNWDDVFERMAGELSARIV